MQKLFKESFGDSFVETIDIKTNVNSQINKEEGKTEKPFQFHDEIVKAVETKLI